MRCATRRRMRCGREVRRAKRLNEKRAVGDTYLKLVCGPRTLGRNSPPWAQRGLPRREVPSRCVLTDVSRTSPIVFIPARLAQAFSICMERLLSLFVVRDHLLRFHGF